MSPMILQWFLRRWLAPITGRDIQQSGHSSERGGELAALGTMFTPGTGTDLNASLELRRRAEQAFRKQRDKDLASRALNVKTRAPEHYHPGDLVFYRRMKEPSDTPASAVVDRPRVRVGRYYGPGRVLACETKVTDGGRKASQMIWIIAQVRFKKCQSSQFRHASEQARIMSGAFQQQAMPWTLSSLTRLLDRGEYDDESIPPPVDRRRGRVVLWAEIPQFVRRRFP